MRYILLLISFVNFLYSYTYNDLLIKTQASIFPKIILLDKKLNNKLIENKIVLSIIYDKNDVYTANTIQSIINRTFNGKIDEHKYRINLIEFDNLTENTKSTAFYILNSSSENIKRVSEIAKMNGVITFSYDINNLRNGLLFSITIEKSTTFYLNKNNLHSKSIDFVTPLLQMVKFIDKENS